MKSCGSNRFGTHNVEFRYLFSQIGGRDSRERNEKDSAARHTSRKQPGNAPH